MCFNEVSLLLFHNAQYSSFKVTVLVCTSRYIHIGSLVMEHPGTHPLPIQGKPTIFGGVNGSIGM